MKATDTTEPRNYKLGSLFCRGSLGYLQSTIIVVPYRGRSRRDFRDSRSFPLHLVVPDIVSSPEASPTVSRFSIAVPCTLFFTEWWVHFFATSHLCLCVVVRHCFRIEGGTEHKARRFLVPEFVSRDRDARNFLIIQERGGGKKDE